VTGTIVKIVSDNGFFFIKGDDSRQYFGHRSALIQTVWIYDIMEGDIVEFDATDSPKGPRAECIAVHRLVA